MEGRDEMQNGKKMTTYKFLASDSASAMEKLLKNSVRCAYNIHLKRGIR